MQKQGTIHAHGTTKGVGRPPKPPLRPPPLDPPLPSPHIKNQLAPPWGSKQRKLSLVFTPLCCSRSPNKALPAFPAWALINFFLFLYIILFFFSTVQHGDQVTLARIHFFPHHLFYCNISIYWWRWTRTLAGNSPTAEGHTWSHNLPKYAWYRLLGLTASAQGLCSEVVGWSLLSVGWFCVCAFRWKTLKSNHPKHCNKLARQGRRSTLPDQKKQMDSLQMSHWKMLPDFRSRKKKKFTGLKLTT